jgi:hypothetical protein
MGNHQERIPWISAHPYDVKRGTFLGEMSRLATLCSQYSDYLVALEGLVSLYIRRGYPASDVHKWLNKHISERWSKRLEEHSSPNEGTDVLVLKTQYNLAWNYFNATQLGDTIFGYWRNWLERADARDFNHEYPAPDEKDQRVSNWETSSADTGLWDLRATNIFNSRVILSRKRTRNMLDLTNLWKKSVLENLEELVLDEQREQPDETHVDFEMLDPTNAATALTLPEHPYLPDINALPRMSRQKMTRDDVSDEDDSHIPEHRRYRSSSPTPAGWRTGASGTWGRGSLR